MSLFMSVCVHVCASVPGMNGGQKLTLCVLFYGSPPPCGFYVCLLLCFLVNLELTDWLE